MNRSLRLTLIWSLLALSACTSAFVSSWTAPDAKPLEFAGSKVVAVVMAADTATRQMGEDVLAQQITAHGAQGIPMYTLFPDIDPSMEAEARAALEKADVKGVVVMRPVNVDKEVVSTPVYHGFWGGYYGYGWSDPWVTSDYVYTDTIVYVETRVYSLEQNKLVWSGRSRTVNPQGIEDLVKEVSGAVAAELENRGLIGEPA